MDNDDGEEEVSEQQARNNMSEGLRKLRASSELTEMATKHMAHMYKIAYQALIDEGFSKDQALTIVVTKGPFLVT